MAKKEVDIISIYKTYKKRFLVGTELLTNNPSVETGLIITIPCYNEPNLIDTLKSLSKCTPANCIVEVLIFINASEDSPKDIKENNIKTFNEANSWIANNKLKWLKYYLTLENELPTKHAGVGLARKTIMDEALARYSKINYNGPIVCLDADCKVSTNYFTSIENSFNIEKWEVATLHYEHIWENLNNHRQIEGIIQYELYLRYYIQALKQIEYPYAYHTIGSSMAVKASTYALCGGMNKRKAGEDFYFLHKVFPQGKTTEITDACVYPSSRESNRVPFGTGKAISKWLANEGQFDTYDFQSFIDLKSFFDQRIHLYECRSTNDYKGLIEHLPVSITDYLMHINFEKPLFKLIKETNSIAMFEKRFFHLWNGFTILKYLHYTRDNHYPNIDLKKACHSLHHYMGKNNNTANSYNVLLNEFRTMDRYLNNS